ncbi:pyridoxal phosphate-dependent aminotransferase [Melioribacter sp. OK-6-Me]|uniref:pyridoxal phosphate-dependent aminotransferase n=1 Tax=unclassified Melioribacter TaxID=2627329 RepID=UPI003EDA2161
MEFKFSDRINRTATSLTMQIAQRAIELRAEGEDVVDFSVGEPDFPTPENIKNAAIKALERNLTKYTINTGIVELRKAIADKLERDNGLLYSTDEIIVSNGAKQCVYNAIQALVGEGDEVLIPAPFYVSYPEMVKLAGGTPVIINTSFESGFKLTPELLESYVTPSTKMLILCNPSNPTGSVFHENELNALKDVLKMGSYFILTDEIYEKIIFDNIRFESVASLGDEIKKRTIVVNGHSKAYSMTGWRIGYAAADRSIVKAMAKVQSHSTSNASTVSQYAALEALTGPQDSVEIMRREFERRRDFLYKELNSIEGIKTTKPEGAFYIFPDVSNYIGKKFNGKAINDIFEFSFFLLNVARVVVVPGIAFGNKNCIRISFSTSMDRLEEGIKRIKNALEMLV